MPGSFCALDAGNQRVRGLPAESLAAALARVGRGPVASVYGRLRPGVLGVDLDLADAGPVAADLVAWCVERGLWHVVRASGRPGHLHVIVVAGAQESALVAFADELRRAYRAGGRSIDVRQQLRPLSAAHRSGVTPPLPGGLAGLARALPAAMAGLAGQPEAAPSPAAAVRALVPAVPPRRLARCDLPQEWADYLAHGRHPAQVAGWADTSRSAVESTATWTMARCGWTAEQAWTAVGAAHPGAFTKARAKGRGWWIACVWNPAVTSLVATAPPARAATDRPEPPAQVAEARAAFLAAWTSYPDPARHTLRRVFDVLLDRMTRAGTARVPCPQRDLVLDTGLSRPTVAGALERLAADGWIVLERTFSPGCDQPDGRSHHASLPPHPPRPWPVRGGVSPSLPPSSFTPRPPSGPAALSLACLLGPRRWHLYLALHAASAPISPEDLASHAGWTTAGTPRSRRTILDALSCLAGAGLARVDDDGAWLACEVEMASDTTIRVAEHAHQQQVEAVGAERAAYAEVRAGHGPWHRSREQALERGAAARAAGARRWWDSLDPGEAQQRQQVWAERYRGMPAREQLAFKTRAAEQRQRAGGPSEDELHRAWISSVPEPQYQARAAERTRWYRGLDLDTQRALVAGWEAHRDRWGIQRRPAPAPAQTPALTAGIDAEWALLDAMHLLEAELGAELVTLANHSPTSRTERSA